jgi:hypothetical protein
VLFRDGFVPRYDDVFTVLTATDLVGSFSNAAPPDVGLPGRLLLEEGTFEVHYRLGPAGFAAVDLRHFVSVPRPATASLFASVAHSFLALQAPWMSPTPTELPLQRVTANV